MLETTVITAVGQVALPLALLLWLWRGHCHRRADWLLKCLSTVAYLAMIAVTGVWLLIPWYVPQCYALLGAGAAWASWRAAGRRVSREERVPRGVWWRRACWALVAFACAGVVAHALNGRRPPVPPVAATAAPLRGGTYFVANGGFSILINPHMKTLDRAALKRYRGQSYALDIVKIDAMGLRARGFWPTDLERYHIFGEPVYAPCDGEVIRVEDRLPDRPPPSSDREHPAGNFVYLGCGETAILLAHLMQGSLAVGAGERVGAGQFLARVGNSGYSTEPHLHLHAQQRVSAESFMAAEPIPLRIEERLPVRGDRLSLGGSGPARITPGHLP